MFSIHVYTLPSNAFQRLRSLTNSFRKIIYYTFELIIGRRCSIKYISKGSLCLLSGGSEPYNWPLSIYYLKHLAQREYQSIVVGSRARTMDEARSNRWSALLHDKNRSRSHSNIVIIIVITFFCSLLFRIKELSWKGNPKSHS